MLKTVLVQLGPLAVTPMLILIALLVWFVFIRKS